MPLKTQSKTYLYILISLVCVCMIALCGYFLLGGFKEIITVKSKNNLYSIAGKEFRGSYKSDTLGMYFTEMKSIFESGALKGDLCLINYQDSTLSNNDVHQFIGILLDDEISEIPSGLSVIELEGETTFIAALVMHPLVRPNSEKIQALLYDLAQESGYELENYSLEKFYPDNSVIVEVFGIEK